MYDTVCKLVVGPGVKHLARIASRPVTWVIKIKHAGLGVLGQFKKIKITHKLQASSRVGPPHNEQASSS